MKKIPLLLVAGLFGLLAALASGAEKTDALAEFLKKLKLEGRPVLVEFGMVGCELSGKGLEEMIALQQEKKIPGLALVRVEENREKAAVDQYYRDRTLPFPLHRDSQGTLAAALDATVVPTFLLVDKFGHVRYRGPYPEKLPAWAQALLDEKEDPGPNARRFDAKEMDVARLLADTRLPDLKGETKPLGEYMGTNGLFVLFVDTKCPYSAKAMADVPAVIKVLQQRQINSVLLNTDDTKETVLSFYASHPPATPVVYDVTAASRKAWGVNSVPIVVLVKADRTVAYQGKAVWAEVGAAVEKANGLAAGTVQFTPKGTRFG